MTRRAVIALGIGQCVNWGVLYYAFAVLVLPVQRDLDVPTWAVTGAFSLALLLSAAIAPAVGRWTDAGRGARVIQGGGAAAAALLVLWALAPSLPTLYLVWAGLGLCMAATLYEPAFAIVGRAQADSSVRLRALAVITLLGGLASTIFLPVTALLVDGVGWQGSVLVLAGLLAASAGLVRIVVFRAPAPGAPAVEAVRRAPAAPGPAPAQSGFVLLMFSLTSLAGAAFTTNLIPALGERAVPSTIAAMLGGLLGLMQLPGRTLLMHGTLGDSPARLVTITLVLQACGLACFSLAPSVLLIGLGVAIFAAGAGMTTLVRPHLVQTLFGIEGAGELNGRIARAQQLARAAGPIVVASCAALTGYAAAFLLLSAGFLAFAVLARAPLERAVNGSRLIPARRETGRDARRLRRGRGVRPA